MIKDLVTIIVLVYNNKRYLENALKSILEQKYRQIEIIINDDGSDDFDDNYMNYIEDFVDINGGDNIYDYKVLKNQKNIGIVRSYNKCISISEGEYIMHLGCDDTFYDEYVVSDVIKHFKESDELIFTTELDTVVDDNQGNGQMYVNNLKRDMENAKIYFNQGARVLYLMLARGNFIPGANTYYKRELIYKYGLLNEDYRLLEDWARWLSLTRRGCQIGLFNRIAIKYRIGGITTGSINNISSTEKNAEIDSIRLRDNDLTIAEERNPHYTRIALSEEYYNENIQKEDMMELSKKKDYYMKLYLQYRGSYFSEENSISRKIEPYKGIIKEKFDLSNLIDLDKIRIDPIEARCGIIIRELYTINDDIKISLTIEETNSHVQYKDILFFDTDDPNILINIENVKLDNLVIVYEFVNYDGVLLR